MKLADIQKEAEHSYSVYLDYSGVLHDINAKLPLLKWIDACSTAVNCIGSADPDKILLLAEELEICAIKPLEAIRDAAAERYKQVLGAGPALSASNNKNLRQRKAAIIRQINNLFKTLATATGNVYKEIEYDPSDR